MQPEGLPDNSYEDDTLMSYSIGVYLPEHRDISLPADPDEMLQHLEQVHQTYCIYERPLGDDLQISVYWSGIASALGLPYVSSIHERGLVVSGVHLETLREELNVLEDYWCSSDLAAFSDYTLDNLLNVLLDRLSDLREAIDLAKSNESELVVL